MDMNNYCNRFMKDDMPFLRDVDKFALTNSIYDAFDAFKNFFEKRTMWTQMEIPLVSSIGIAVLRNAWLQNSGSCLIV